jgi:hypothetical protein
MKAENKADEGAHERYQSIVSKLNSVAKFTDEWFRLKEDEISLRNALLYVDTSSDGSADGDLENTRALDEIECSKSNENAEFKDECICGGPEVLDCDVPIDKSSAEQGRSFLQEAISYKKNQMSTEKEMSQPFAAMTRECSGPEIIEDDDEPPRAVPLTFAKHGAYEVNKKLNRDNPPSRFMTAPEVFVYGVGAPVPESFTQQRSSIVKVMSLLPGTRDHKKVTPVNTVGVFDEIQRSNHYSSTHSSGYDRGPMKSRNSSEKGLAVACPVTDEEQPVYVASHYEPSVGISTYKSTKCYIYTALALLLIGAAIAIGVACVATDRFGIPEAKERDREARILQVIQDNVLERNATFGNMSESDPRYVALDWIHHNDGLKLTYTSSNLLQRYIIAVLAFSFELNSWECGMVGDIDSCNMNMTDDYDDYLPWLTPTDECMWFGVECDDRGFVVGLDLSEFRLLRHSSH